MTTTPVRPAKTLSQLVARQIKIVMLDADDMRQSQLARKIGKSEQWLSVRLRGVQPIDVNDLALIAKGLEVSVHELLPDPDTASAASVEPTVRYDPVRPMAPRTASRPVDNRPSGRPDPATTNGVRRTNRLPRPDRRRTA